MLNLIKENYEQGFWIKMANWIHFQIHFLFKTTIKRFLKRSRQGQREQDSEVQLWTLETKCMCMWYQTREWNPVFSAGKTEPLSEPSKDLWITSTFGMGVEVVENEMG